MMKTLKYVDEKCFSRAQVGAAGLIWLPSIEFLLKLAL